jgi:hypothetical protein
MQLCAGFSPTGSSVYAKHPFSQYASGNNCDNVCVCMCVCLCVFVQVYDISTRYGDRISEATWGSLLPHERCNPRPNHHNSSRVGLHPPPSNAPAGTSRCATSASAVRRWRCSRASARTTETITTGNRPPLQNQNTLSAPPPPSPFFFSPASAFVCDTARAEGSRGHTVAP